MPRGLDEDPTIVDYGDLQELTAACLGGNGGDAGFPSTVGGYTVLAENPYGRSYIEPLID